jgi:hypothetical protein
VKTLSLQINPMATPVINNVALPNGTQGTAYAVTITASNNPSSFSATGLPGGLTLNSSTGVISGTPSVSGSFNVNLSASNSSGTGPVKSLSLIINGNAAPVINNTSLASGNVGVSYSVTISATNNPTSFAATGMPVGLTLNTSTGLISGTPTRPGNYSVTFSATNPFGSGSKTLPLIINEPVGTTACLRAAQTMVIDGNLNEGGWVISKSISKNTIGTANNTGTFGVLWDASNLYVGARVMDANLFSDSGNPWEDDAIEIYIDANNNKLTTYDGRDNQIIKSYNKSTIYAKLSVTGLQHGWFAISGGYSIEVSIPWSQLGIASPVNGTTIGFDVAYDDDDNGSTRDRQSVWNGTVNNYANTSAFGTLVLSNAVSRSPLARMRSDEDLVDPIEITDEDISYWPNPVTDNLHIETDGSFKTIAVLDMLGKTYFTDRFIKGKTSLDIDLSHLGDGYHLIKLTGKRKSKVIRILKIR